MMMLMMLMMLMMMICVKQCSELYIIYCIYYVLCHLEISQRVYLINAGWMLSTLWEAAKPFIPARTLQKVKILGNSSTDQAVIFPDVSGGASSLPTYLGGELLADECPQICPAMTVDDAYGVVLKEIFDCFVKNSTDPLLYPTDTKEFLDAALVHARSMSKSSAIHQQRIDDIIYLFNSQ